MSRAVRQGDEDLRRLTEAAAWRVRLTEEDAETSEAFEAWIADPLNEAAWDQVQAPWREVGEKATSPELMAARAGALARARREGRLRWTSTARGRIAASLAAIVLATGAYAGRLSHDARRAPRGAAAGRLQGVAGLRLEGPHPLHEGRPQARAGRRPGPV